MNRITYVGHATLLLELDGSRFLTDPLLRRMVAHVMRTGPVPDPEQLLPVDAVLISHLHGDHLHLPSLRLLPEDTLIVAPHGAAVFLRRSGWHNVTELETGQHTAVNGIEVEAVPADHPGRPMPRRPRTEAVGYVLHASHHVYFTGDTDIFPGMQAIGEAVDVALLPVWGWGPTLGVGHMDPYRAARSLELLEPALAIPIHWGTYFPIGLRAFLPGYLRRPPLEFREHARRFAPAVEVQILDPGEAIDLTPYHVSESTAAARAARHEKRGNETPTTSG